MTKIVLLARAYADLAVWTVEAYSGYSAVADRAGLG